LSKEIEEAVAAASQVANGWLQGRDPSLSLRIERMASIKPTVAAFVHGGWKRKVGHWDWVRLFHKEVKWNDAWLFSLLRGQQPVALCLGSISIQEDHVAIEYLERRLDVPGVKGVPLAAAFQFAAAVAAVLELGQVRVNNPINDTLVDHYARTLHMTPVRQTPGGRVDYLYRNVKI